MATYERSYKGDRTCAWYEDDDHGSPVHGRVFAHVQALEEDQIDVHLQNMLNARLYTNRDMMAFEWNSPIAAGFRPLNANLENIIQVVCDTLVSRIGSNRPKPTIVTRGADFDVYLRGRQLNRFLWGEFEHHDLYHKIRRCFLDSLVYGTAFLKMDIDDGELYMERVHPDEVIVDQRECISGESPACMYQRKLVSRLWLKQTYAADDPDLAACIDAAQGHGFQYTSYRSPADEQIVVVEAWKRPTRKGAGDGRHVVCIDNYCFVDEAYTDETFPFIELRFAQPENGYYGRPLVTDLMDYQIRLNELNGLIRLGQDIMCVPRILNEKGSQILLSQLDNQIAKVLEYRGTKPEALTWDAFNAEIYNERERIKSSAFAFAGLSEMIATGAPATSQMRYDSSEALREVSSMQDERYNDKIQEYEQFVINIAKRMITLCARLYKNHKKNSSTFYRSGQLVQQIDWKSVSLDDDKYVLQVSASSVLNMSPAARKDKLEYWRKEGVINLAQYHAMSGEPDLEKLSDQLTAGSDAIEYQIDTMLKGKPATPTILDKLQTGLPMVHDTYNRLTTLEAPARVLVLFRQWISIAKQLMSPKMPPAPMPGQPTLGPPGGPMPVDPTMQPAGPAPMPATGVVPNGPAPVQLLS